MKFILLLFLIIVVLPLHGEDWSVLGRTFHNVKVTQIEADRVHVVYDFGVGTINIADMLPELRKRFTSDVAAAKAAADAREKARLAVVASLPPLAPAPVVVNVTPPVVPAVAMGSINDDVLGHTVIEDLKDAHGKNTHQYSVGANDH